MHVSLQQSTPTKFSIGFPGHCGVYTRSIFFTEQWTVPSPGIILSHQHLSYNYYAGNVDLPVMLICHAPWGGRGGGGGGGRRMTRQQIALDAVFSSTWLHKVAAVGSPVLFLCSPNTASSPSPGLLPQLIA